MNPPRRFWMEMPTVAFDGDTSGWIAVFPVAAVEQHGPHLPVGVDSHIAEGMIARVLDRAPSDLPLVCLPLQCVGKSNEHAAFPGTLTLGWETALRAWLEIGASVAGAGVRKIVVVTSHGGNAALIDILTRELRLKHGLLAVHTAWAAHGCPAGAIDPGEARLGIHGGEIETSLMLEFRPELVDMTRAAAFIPATVAMEKDYKVLRAARPAGFGWASQDLHPSGVIGNPAGATREKGRLIADFYADKFIELLADMRRFDPASLKPVR